MGNKFISFNAGAPASPKAPPMAPVDQDPGASARQAGKAIIGFGTEIKERQERNDVTRVHTMQSTAMADLSLAFSQLEKDAPLGAEGHVENVSSFVSKYYEDRQGQATTEKGKLLLQRQQAKVLSHFVRKGITFQSASLGAKVKGDYLTSLNADKNTLLQSPDQATFDLTLKNSLAKIADPTGAIHAGLTGQSRAELSRETIEDLTKARVQGLIRQDPEGALIDIESGAFPKLNAEDVKPLIADAKRGIKEEEADRKQTAADIKDHDTKIREEKTSAFVERLSSGDPTKYPSHKELGGSGLKRATITALQGSLKNLKNDSRPGALNKTIIGIHSGKIKTTEDLEKLLADNYINIADFKLARIELGGAGTRVGKIEQQLKKALIKHAQSSHAVSNDLMRLRNPEGDATHAAWLSQFLPAWDAAIAKGVSPVALVDPKSKDYLGGGIRVQTSTQILSNMLRGSNNRPTLPTPPTPGAAAKPDINKATHIRGNPTTGERIFLFEGVWYNEDGTVRN